MRMRRNNFGWDWASYCVIGKPCRQVGSESLPFWPPSAGREIGPGSSLPGARCMPGMVGRI